MFALASFIPAGAQTESVIHSFRSTSVFDGIQPFGGLFADANGALYGVAGGGKYGAGAVYKLVPPATQGGAWTQNILYPFMGSFNGARDGSNPSGGIVFAAASSRNGKIYGTTQGGGLYGGGTVYELSRPTQPGSPWTETILYNFGQGVEAISGVIAGAEGRLYGTTVLGGRYNSGTVFVLSPPAQLGGAWTERVLYSFNSRGTLPQGHPTSVVLDASGSLYGATSLITANNSGVIFQLSPPSGGKGAWTENVLYTFTGQAGDGIEPSGGLVFDSSGALYGVTLEGGQLGNGAVYKVAPPAAQGGAWTETVLYSFSPGSGDGANPVAALAFDIAGALYGVTQSGGILSCGDAAAGCGAAFKISPPATQGGPWTEGFLYPFQGGSDGNFPQASVVVVGTSVYGTTWLGGTGICNGVGGQLGCGTVFQVTQ
jgi:uncharacterized repeat protein (TIGR03803 family)